MEQQPIIEFSTQISPPFDPLLQCLVLVSKMHNKPTSSHALVSGMPLVNHKLTPDLFIRAAKRIGLSAQLVNTSLEKINARQLPTVLLMKNKQSCVLTAFRENGQFQVILPESGSGTIDIDAKQISQDFTGQALFVAKAFKFEERTEKLITPKPRRWFWGVMLRAWPIYSEVVVASFLINLFALGTPLFIMNVYDRVVPNKAIETLWVLAIGLMIVIGFDFLMRSIRGYFIETAGKHIDVKLSTNTYEQLLGINMASRPNSMGVLANTVHAFEIFREFITAATVSTFVDLPFVFLFIGIIWLIAGNLALIPLIAIPIVILVSLAIQLPQDMLVKQSYRYSAEKQAILLESLANIETIKSMRAEGLMQSKWETLIKPMAEIGIKLRLLSNIGINFSLLAQQLCILLVVAFGVYKISEGDLTMGGLVASTILTGRALAPIAQVAGLLIRYKQSITSLQALDTIMKLPVERPENKHFIHHENFHGAIEFNTISLTYPGQSITALDNVSFKINPGEHVGIIGAIGSGKTSIVKLILRLYEPTAGNILIDGTESHQLDPVELRRHIGYVPQTVNLFHGSIRDNIVIGAPYVDDNTVIRAAKNACVDSFVNRDPNGFDRNVGERGEYLSNGQRQAIAIARAILLEPPMLIFDEPTNFMDQRATLDFVQRLKQYYQHKTLVLVTHKKSMISLVDRLIVVDHGKIVANGTKQDILKNYKT